MRTASTHSTGSADEFREWLKDEMEARSWKQTDLARALGMTKGSVNKWLHDDDNPYQRTPAYTSLRKIADLFGVDLRKVLEMAGVEDPRSDEHLSDIQRNVMWMIPQIDDRLLAVVQPQIRALISPATQQQALDHMYADIDGTVRHIVKQGGAKPARSRKPAPAPAPSDGTPVS